MSMEHDFYLVRRQVDTNGEVKYKIWDKSPVETLFGENRLKPLFWHCRSMDVSEKVDGWFGGVKVEQLDEKLMGGLGFDSVEDARGVCFSQIALVSLTREQTNFIRSGYFLIEDVNAFCSDRWSDELFFDSLTPSAYAAKSANEAKMSEGVARVKQQAGEHLACDYMYFTFEDETCLEHGLAFARDVACAWGEDDLSLLHFVC